MLKTIVVLLISLTLVSSVCSPYPSTGFCSPVTTTDVDPLFGFEGGEAILVSQSFPELKEVGGAIDPVCADIATRFICAYLFPTCNSTQTTYVCRSSCEDFYSKCESLFHSLNVTVPIQCEGLSSTNCNQLNSISEPPADFVCPSPLIMNPRPEISNPNCVGICCVPCPQTHYFYPESSVDTIDKLVFSVAIISLFASITALLSYSLMPEKRSFPSNLIFCIALGLFLSLFPIFFLVGDTTRVRCNDEITQAFPGQNHNNICKFQATFIIYGFLTSVYWFFILVLNIFVSVMFLSKKLQDYKLYFHLVGWTLPWISVIVAHALNSTGYSFGISCAVDSGAYLNGMMLIPIACLVFPSVIMNILVLLKIAWVARKRNASLQSILKLQIRSFFFVTIALTVFLFYWIFIEVDVVHLKIDTSAPWIKDWFFCVASGNGQTKCSEIAKPYLPAIVPFAIAEILVYGLALVIFGFFVVKKDVIDFWKEIFKGNFKRIHESQPSSFENKSTNKSTNRSTHKSTKKDELEDDEMEMKRASSAQIKSTDKLMTTNSNLNDPEVNKNDVKEENEKEEDEKEDEEKNEDKKSAENEV